MTGLVERSEVPETPAQDRLLDDRLSGGLAEVLRPVYDAVVEVPITARSEPGGWNLHTLLTLLTYCYARGFYSAAQIEAMSPSDPAIRYICVGGVPSAHEIRAFRRAHKAAVARALENLLAAISASPDAAAESARRVRRAVQQDSFDLDV